MFLKPSSLGKEKLNSRWEIGHFLGIRNESGELYIGTELGVLKILSYRSYEQDPERWGAGSLIGVQGLPWESAPGRVGIAI